MSQYATSEYYFSNFKGNKLQLEDADRYLQLASEKINDITFNRIENIGFDNLTDFQKEKVQYAVCYQAEYILENGYNDENNQDISSYSVLDISITSKDDKDKSEAEKNCMSEIAYSYIKKTGLSCKVI